MTKSGDRSDRGKGRREATPLVELARGFRKRTLVTTRMLSKVGFKMAKRNFGFKQSLDNVDEDDAVAAAHLLLEQLDGLKGLSMKIGQMLSYLDGMVPPKAQRVLARLQFESRPMAFEQIAKVVKDELGDEPARVFDEFETEPFAAASIGQVHRAVIDGQRVAVKVQYPGIEALVKTDVRTIRRLSRLMLMLSPLDGGGILTEMAERFVEECDYRLEAKNQRYFRELFGQRPGLAIPKVFTDLSTRRVLTTEYIDALDFYSFRECATQEAKNRAATTIFGTCFEGLFQHRSYNADPHPGNYLFDVDGNVTLLDFGCVKRFDPDFIEGWKRIARAILDDDVDAFRVAWIDAGFVGRKWRFDFQHQLDAMKVLYTPMRSTKPFTFTHGFVEGVHDTMVFRNRNKFRLAVPPDWLFVNRLQFGLLSVLAHLDATARWDRVFRAVLDGTASSSPQVAGETDSPRVGT